MGKKTHEITPFADELLATDGICEKTHLLFRDLPPKSPLSNRWRYNHVHTDRLKGFKKKLHEVGRESGGRA